MNFINGIEMNKQHPDTFLIPSEEEKNKLKIGTYIKIGRNGERFWVEIISIQNNDITGRVDNDLILDHPFKFNDKITIGKKHILDIYKVNKEFI